jgi:hypothetical protein
VWWTLWPFSRRQRRWIAGGGRLGLLFGLAGDAGHGFATAAVGLFVAVCGVAAGFLAASIWDRSEASESQR